MAKPNRSLILMVACNDHRNGTFARRATNIQIDSGGGWQMDLDHDDFEDGAAFTADSRFMRIRIHRTWFPFKSQREWVGNWCWNAYRLNRGTALRLIECLAASGRWHCTAAPSRVDAWWERRCHCGAGAAIRHAQIISEKPKVGHERYS